MPMPGGRAGGSAAEGPADEHRGHRATTSEITKPGTLDGAMPAKLSLNMRPNTAAGLANEVDAVNQ